MSHTIWKFPLETADSPVISAPRGARFFCVQIQHGQACVWAIVDPTEPQVDHKLVIHGTGHPVDVDNLGAYIGTYQLSGGALVFHVFHAKTS